MKANRYASMTSINLPSFVTTALLEELASAEPRLRPGDVVNAIVLGMLNKETLRIQLPDGILDVATKTALAPGTQVEVTVEGTQWHPRFVLNPIPQNPAGNAPAQAANAPQPLAGAAPEPADIAEQAPHVLTQQLSAPQVATPQASTPQTAASQISSPALAEAESQPLAAAAAQSAIDAAPAAAVQKLAAAIVSAAAARQDSVAPLYADLAATFERADAAIPPKVVAAVQQLFALRLDVQSKSAVDAGEIKTAVLRSGLTPEPQVATDPRPATTPVDLKSALQSLRVALSEWLDTGAPAMPAGLVPPQAKAEQKAAPRSQVPMPPFRNAPTSAQPAAAPTVGGNMPMRELIRHLLGETDAAIARQTLLQIASLSRDGKADAGNARVHAGGMTLEIPLQTGQGTAVWRSCASNATARTAAPTQRRKSGAPASPSTSSRSARCMRPSRSPPGAPR
jgi:hypothetical protein